MSVWILIGKSNNNTMVSCVGYETYMRAKADLDVMVDNGMKRIDEYKVQDVDRDVLYEIKPVAIIK